MRATSGRVTRIRIPTTVVPAPDTEEQSADASETPEHATDTDRRSRGSRRRNRQRSSFTPAVPEERSRSRPERIQVIAPIRIAEEADTQRVLQRLADVTKLQVNLRIEQSAAAFLVNSYDEPVAELRAAVRGLTSSQLLLDALAG